MNRIILKFPNLGSLYHKKIDMSINKFNREEFTKNIAVDSGIDLELLDIGEGPVVLLIHGWPLNNKIFDSQAQFLSEKGYRVIAPTLRGFGSSSKPIGDYTYEIYASDIHEIVKRLNLNNFVIGGYSMGAAIATLYTAKYGKDSVKQLWLISGAVPVYTQKKDYIFDGPTVGYVNESITFLENDRPGLVKAVISALWSSLSPIPEHYSNWLYSVGMEASMKATKESLIALRDSDLRPELRLIEKPIIIFHGRHDIISPIVLAQDIENDLSNAKLIVFENSGHAVPFEEEELFNQSLLQALSI